MRPESTIETTEDVATDLAPTLSNQSLSESQSSGKRKSGEQGSLEPLNKTPQKNKKAFSRLPLHEKSSSNIRQWKDVTEEFKEQENHGKDDFVLHKASHVHPSAQTFERNQEEQTLTIHRPAHDVTKQQKALLFKLRLAPSKTLGSWGFLEEGDKLSFRDELVTSAFTYGGPRAQQPLIVLTQFHVLNSHSQLVQVVVIRPKTITDGTQKLVDALYRDLCSATQVMAEMLVYHGQLTWDQKNDIDMIVRQQYEGADISVVRWVSRGLQSLWKTHSEEHLSLNPASSTTYASSSKNIEWRSSLF